MSIIEEPDRMFSPPGVEATQQISQSYYDEFIEKSKNARVSVQAYKAGERIDSQFTLNEGDTGHIDIASSFLVQNESSQDADLEKANVSSTQIQRQWTQFPESQRFKTPATAGKKRKHNGQAVGSPEYSRNPLLRGIEVTPAKIMGLSQAFAATQAASSPFENGLPTTTRSDRPSPDIHLYNKPATARSSSPLQAISEFKRAATEPASRYVSLRQSQAKRIVEAGFSDDDDVNIIAHQSMPHDDSDDEEPSLLVRKRMENERAERVRQALLQLSSRSPELAPKQNDGVNGALVESDSDDGVAAGLSEEETDREDDRDVYVRRSSQLQHAGVLDKENAPHLIPETTFRRQNGVVSQVDGSPSERLAMAITDVSKKGFSSSGPARVADSQPSQPRNRVQQSVQNVHGRGNDAVDLVPASQNLELSCSNSQEGSSRAADGRLTKRPDFVARGKHNDTSLDPEYNDSASDRIMEDSVVSREAFVSTVPETTSSQRQVELSNNSKLQTTANLLNGLSSTRYDTAETHHRSSGSSSSSSPNIAELASRNLDIQRLRMTEIGAEAFSRRSETQESFNAAEALALDADFGATNLVISPKAASARPHIVLTQDTPQRLRQRLDQRDTDAVNSSRSNHTANISRRLKEQTFEGDSARSPELSQEIVRPYRSRNDHVLPGDKASPQSSNRQRISNFDIGTSPQPRTRAQSGSTMHRKQLRRSKTTPVPNNPYESRTDQEQAQDTSPLPDPVVRGSASEHLCGTDTAIVAPNMVFACFNGKSRAYYPALCVGRAEEDPARFIVQWEGYEPDTVDAHGVRSLDLRIGDAVKVNLAGFPKVAHTIRSFDDSCKETLAGENLTDIYGHRSLIVVPKKAKGSTQTTNSEQHAKVPLGAVYLDSNMWGQMKDREFVFVHPKLKPAAAGMTTPIERPSTPTTPSSRTRRPLVGNKSLTLSTTGLFANMAFAVSLDNAGERHTVLELVRHNGGLILADSFEDLFMSDFDLKSNMTGLGFAALLTDKHSRKIKYLQALALGLPCLNLNWVKVCVDHDRLVNWFDYLLPAGESAALGGAVRSRILPAMDLETAKFAAMLAARPQCFHEQGVILVRGRSKDESRRAFLFLIDALGAAIVESAIDVKTAVELVSQAEPGKYRWLFVDEKDLKSAIQLISVSRKTSMRRKSSGSDGRIQCRVSTHETIIQSLILGRLYEVSRLVEGDTF